MARIGITSSFIVDFNYAMHTASVNLSSSVKDGNQSAVSVSKGWSLGNTRLTLDPVSTLHYNEAYSVVILSGCVTSASKPILSDKTYSFYTEDPPVIITTFSPVNNAANVSVSGNFTATFAYAMDTATVSASFSFVDKSGNPVAHSKTWSGGDTILVIDPTPTLNWCEPYYITFGTGSTATNSYYIPTATLWGVTTAQQVSIVSGTTPEDGGYEFSITGTVVIDFNFPMLTATVNNLTWTDHNLTGVNCTKTWSNGDTRLTLSATAGHLLYSEPYIVTLPATSSTTFSMTLGSPYVFSFFVEDDDIVSGSYTS